MPLSARRRAAPAASAAVQDPASADCLAVAAVARVPEVAAAPVEPEVAVVQAAELFRRRAQHRAARPRRAAAQRRELAQSQAAQ